MGATRLRLAFRSEADSRTFLRRVKAGLAALVAEQGGGEGPMPPARVSTRAVRGEAEHAATQLAAEVSLTAGRPGACAGASAAASRSGASGGTNGGADGAEAGGTGGGPSGGGRCGDASRRVPFEAVHSRLGQIQAGSGATTARGVQAPKREGQGSGALARKSASFGQLDLLGGSDAPGPHLTASQLERLQSMRESMQRIRACS